MLRSIGKQSGKSIESVLKLVKSLIINLITAMKLNILSAIDIVYETVLTDAFIINKARCDLQTKRAYGKTKVLL